MRSGLALGVALLLTGCAFPHQIGDIAMDYNSAVARTVDELTLLNILRARERQPLHFTAISALRGSIAMSAQATLGINAHTTARTLASGPGGVDQGSSAAVGGVGFSPGGSLSVASEPSFDVAVLNSQEFQRGILKPVTPQLLDYFLEQGWPPDFLTALFVERVEYRAARAYPGYAAGDVIETVDNRPDRAATAAQFGRFLTCFALRPVTIPGGDTPVIDMGELGRASSLGDLQIFNNGNFAIREVKGEDGKPRRVIMRADGPEAGLALASMSRAAASACDLPEVAPTGSGDMGDGAPRIQLSGFQTASDTSAAPPANVADARTLGRIIVRNGEGTLEAAGKRYQVITEMVLRSPLGVIYFLGEYARAKEPYRVRGLKLIDIREGTAPDAFVRTQLMGQHYYLRAKDDESRSLQALTLVEQVINLQKSASELPSTGAVQIVR